MTFDTDFARKVVDGCYELYTKVSFQKKKVLSDNEWTNMACIVKTVDGSKGGVRNILIVIVIYIWSFSGISKRFYGLFQKKFYPPPLVEDIDFIEVY